MCALDAGTSSVGFAEPIRCLQLSHALKRFVMLACLHADDTRLLFRFCTLGTRGTGRAVTPCKARFESRAVGRIAVRQPGNALFSRRARDNRCLPIDHECALVEAGIVSGLPAWILRYGANDLDAM